MTATAPRTTPAPTAIHERPTTFPSPVLVLLSAASLLALAPVSAGVEAGGAVVRAADSEPVAVDEALPVEVESTRLSPESSEVAEAVGEEESLTVAVASSTWLVPSDVVVSAVGLAGKFELKPVQQGM